MRRKTIQLTIRFADEEDREIRRAAALDDEPVASYVRSAALRVARERVRTWAEGVVLGHEGVTA